MNSPIRILAFSGSARQGSFNQSLVEIAATGAIAAGAEVTTINLRDYPMPLYNADLQEAEGFPTSVVEFKVLLKSHQGFLIACPEYNSSITPLLKNAIDWASRPEAGEAPLALTCFQGKVAALMATSPGGLGGLRGLNHVRSILESIGTLVIPNQKAIPGSTQAFDQQGQLQDPRLQEAVLGLGKTLANITQKLQGS
jgi:chromate reductase, NAD(P)H dehydrogenase (quinone)